MIEAAGALITRKPHQGIVDETKQTIDLGPNHHGLAIVVPYYTLLDLTNMLRETLGFAVYVPQDKTSLKSHLQSVDLVELKHHPIIVAVSGLEVE